MCQLLLLPDLNSKLACFVLHVHCSSSAVCEAVRMFPWWMQHAHSCHRFILIHPLPTPAPHLRNIHKTCAWLCPPRRHHLPARPPTGSLSWRRRDWRGRRSSTARPVLCPCKDGRQATDGGGHVQSPGETERDVLRKLCLPSAVIAGVGVRHLGCGEQTAWGSFKARLADAWFP